MDKANVFIIGMDGTNVETLKGVPNAKHYRFHGLLSMEELQHGQIDVAALLAKAQTELDAFEGKIDAIVGYWDFPTSVMAPILCRRYGLPGASLESVVKCEHKYWSRLEQRKVIDEYPRFAVVEPNEDPRPPSNVRYPMWVKPVKGFSSDLAFLAENDEQFAHAVTKIRAGVGRVGNAFDYIMAEVELPPEIAEAGGQACLAEEALPGAQAVTEGYVHDGEVTVYGALDSINYPDSACFLRHRYPSRLPADVVRRMTDISKKVMRQVGFESATFSVEFFCDIDTGSVNLLEINPRHSQSHAELFELVDGVPNHHCMISLGLGRDPKFPRRQGKYAIAAKWYYRRFIDGVVRRVPTPEEIASLREELPGVTVNVVPAEGVRLSDLPGQDSYSYELAHIVVGASDEAELREKYDRCVAALPFEFDDEDAG